MIFKWRQFSVSSLASSKKVFEMKGPKSTSFFSAKPNFLKSKILLRHKLFLNWPHFLLAYTKICSLFLTKYAYYIGRNASHKVCFETKITKLYSKMILVKRSENNFVFLPVFYLIMWLMKASKNFGKIAILKIWELISLGGIKTHFGKLAL